MAWRSNQSQELYYDKVVERLLHYSYVKLPETVKQSLSLFAQDYSENAKLNLKENLKETLSHLASISERAEYRLKLRLLIPITQGKLSQMMDSSEETASNQLQTVNASLKKHYVERLDALNSLVKTKMTFSGSKMNFQ